MQHLAVEAVCSSMLRLAVIAEDGRNRTSDVTLHTRRWPPPRITRSTAGKAKREDDADEDMAWVHDSMQDKMTMTAVMRATYARPDQNAAL